MKITKVVRILLCLVPALCFLILPSLAADFTDAAAIAPAYRNAVDEMTARGVLAGFPDGSFEPGETLTREQGAKIVACLCLGKSEAEKLRCEKASFDDVAADRWSAPCIAWCVEQSILNGYGNGKYGPGDTLTCDQYAKMLLCALGIAKNAGSYTGKDWYHAVRLDAKAAGLYSGDASTEASNPITRAQAALLSRNAVEASDAAKNPAASATPKPLPGKGDIVLPEVP